MSRRRDRVKARKQPDALFPATPTRVEPAVAPLRCPKCNAPVPLGSADVATCGFCQTQVPLPEEYIALRASQQERSADRAAAEALYEKLGKPPGPLLRGWVAFTTTFTGLAGGVIFGIFYLLVSACAVLAFLAGFAIAFLSHAIATLINIDVVERFGAFRTYAGLVVGLVVFVLFPMWLKSYFETTGAIRKTLLTNLAARPPEQPGFPSTCRMCGAALDVPQDALGVRCEYCQADNLVAIPPERLGEINGQKEFHRSIVEADAQARALRKDARKDLPQAAKWAAIIALALGIVGKGCVALDVEADIPSFSESMGPPRLLFPEGGDEKEALPIDTEAVYSGLSKFGVALHHGEVLELVSRDDGWCTHTSIHNTTTFPLLVRDYEAIWKPQTDRTSAARFRAPYTGLFRLEMTGLDSHEPHSHLEWRIGAHSKDGAPPAPPMTVEPATVEMPPPLPPDAKALADKLGADLVVNPPARPDLLIVTGPEGPEQAVLYSVASGEKIFDLDAKGNLVAIAADRDGHGLVVSGRDYLTVWSIPDDLEHIKDKLVWFGSLCDMPRPTAIVFLDAHAFAIGDETGTIVMHSVETGQVLYELPRGPAGVTWLAMSADGLALTATYGATAKKFVVARPELWSK